MTFFADRISFAIYLQTSLPFDAANEENRILKKYLQINRTNVKIQLAAFRLP